ncbi:receptor protein [Salix suchowensis]|nr:receptor protein [Salix suchowensis]
MHAEDKFVYKRRLAFVVCQAEGALLRMRQLWVWMLLMALAFVNDRCHCCLQEERSSLLEIKAWFSHAGAGFYELQGWDKEHFNCCNWGYRVACDRTTNRVIKLDLSYVNFYALEDLYLNASLFLPFKELEILDLRGNQLVGGLKNQGFQALASVLRKLKDLRLSNNKFNDSILSSLSGFSTLESLDLSYNYFTGTIGFQGLASGLRKLKDLRLSNNIFNDNILSSLSGFSTLESLDLSYNRFTGTIGFQGLASGLRKLKDLRLSNNKFNDNILSSLTSGLRKLEELTLSNNKFNDSILSSLSGFSTLISLYLSNNSFTGTIGLRGLRKLEVLHMDSIDFKENILMESLGGLPSLKTLHASDSKFEGKHFGKGLCNSTSLEEMFLHDSSLPASFLGNIGTTLKVLSLTGVDFHGTSPAQGWCELKNLERLYLGRNNLKGVLPHCLENLSSLQYLDLSDNQFEGNIAFSHLSHLLQLEDLLISNNYFQVPISFGSFMNLSNLKLQLNSFSASSCTSKLLNVGFPTFLRSQYDLVFVDLSHNKFIGEPFPSWLVENNTMLNRLYLRNTSFIGPLQLLQNPRPNLHTIDLSDNNIHGQLARNTCLIFPRLQNFIMANNSLTGCIPPCFGTMSSVEKLDLSNNNMSCELLEHNLLKGGRLLSYLKLSNNNFYGRLPPSMFNMTHLRYLYLDGNKFVGEVPGTFALTLQIIDISNNLLSGMLPRGIGNSSISLEVIDLSRNYFEGTIPIEYFNSYGLEFLDLSENNLSGSLPLGFDAPSLRYVHLYRNQLSGPLPYAFYNLSSLVTLDLGDNNLTGPIPDWIDNLSELSIFVLKSNQFNGELPHQLCLLRRLSILDLSENNFSGHLPSCLSNLNFTASDEKSGFSYRTRSNVYMRYAEVEEINVKIVVELTNKKNIYTYVGDILRYMSAVDLSCNRFIGEIPIEWGNLRGIHSLNLSQNNLTGLIPSSFSNLKQIESLDLSHNNLNGRIPAQLIELTFLEVFNVSYNNLSGRTPEMKNQFGTFDESCYKGNPLLCGPLLPNSCDKIESPLERVLDNSNGDDGSIDMDSFYVSFGVSYIIMVLTILAVLCINPYWRRRWFYFIEECIDTCYCILTINFQKFFRFRR